MICRVSNVTLRAKQETMRVVMVSVRTARRCCCGPDLDVTPHHIPRRLKWQETLVSARVNPLGTGWDSQRRRDRGAVAEVF
jgi:hypothetical protein